MKKEENPTHSSLDMALCVFSFYKVNQCNSVHCQSQFNFLLRIDLKVYQTFIDVKNGYDYGSS